VFVHGLFVYIAMHHPIQYNNRDKTREANLNLIYNQAKPKVGEDQRRIMSTSIK
jgi:hypothetical protein